MLDLDAFPYRLPGTAQEGFLQFVQPALGRAHQVGRPHLAHLGQTRFGGDAAVHDPDPPRMAVARFDAVEEFAQGAVVAAVAGQHFVAQRKAFRCDDQGDHHLPAVTTLVAAVAILAQVFRSAWGVALEIGAGQVVEQDVETRAEQFAPTPLEELEQRVLVFDQPIQTAVQRVLLGQREVRIEQVGHRAAVIPLAVQPPLRARVHQPVHHQGLEHLLPGGTFPRRRQAWVPEVVQRQFLPHLQRQPARTPLAWAFQAQLGEPHADRVDIVIRQRSDRKQSHLPAPTFVEDFHRLAPRLALTGIDFAQVEHLPLGDPAIAQTPVLHDIPVFVDLAIFLSTIAAQEHA
jgi:hypothetical protein